MQIDVSDFCLVCYYDKETNKLVRIKQYINNFSDIEADIKRYEYGYNAVVIKPEQLMEQLQQLKADNEELKNKNNAIHSIANDLQQRNHNLTLENEKLKSDLQEETKLGHKAICDEADRFFEVVKLQKVLDEIEKIAKNGVKDDCGMPLDELSIILQLIKQAKEGGE